MRNKRSALFRNAASVVVGAALGISAIAIASAQSSPPASPPASPIDLTWNAPAGCSDGAAILNQVSALRGGRTTAADHLTAVANVALDASGVWNLQITTTFADGTHGERQIQAESCKAAAEATASILALALTARAAVPPTSTASSSTTLGDAGSPEAAPTTAITTGDAQAPIARADVEDAGPPHIAAPDLTIQPPEVPPPEPPRSNASFHGYAGLFVGGTTGDLPSLGLGAGALLGGTYGVTSLYESTWTARLEGYADYFAFGRARFRTPGGANFQVFSAGLRTCLSYGGAFSVGPCAAFELGSMRAQSFDVSRPSSGSALVANGFLGALGRLSLDKNREFALRALLEIGPSFEQPQFVLDGVGFVHQPGSVVGRGTVGAELRF